MNSIKGGLISLSGSFFQQGISLAGTLILARILSPEDYGIYGLCFTMFVFFQAFLDFGITPIYIKLDYVDDQINSAFFFVNIFFGAMVSFILLIIAPFFADYFKIPLLKPLLYTQAIIPFLQSISNQPFGQLLRTQKFVSAEITSVGSNLIAMGVGIICAIAGLGPWSLVYKHMAFNISRISGGVWFSKAKYSRVNLQQILEIKKYIVQASHLTASRFATGISGNLEKLMVGKIFGEASLGHYNQGLFVVEKPYAFSNALTTPAMSYIARMNPDKYSESYTLLSQLILAFIGLPCLIFFLYGDSITVFILGEKWIEAGSYVVFLSFLGLSLIVKSLCNIILVNETDTKKLFIYNLWCIILTYPPSLYILLHYDNLLWFVTIFSLLTLLFWFIILALCFFTYIPIKSHATQSLSYIVMMLSIFPISGILLKTYLFNAFTNWNILMEGLCCVFSAFVITFSILWIAYRSILLEQYKFIIDRLKKDRLS
jgi:O-antigen/teichoic acid export membrane protein